MLILREGGVASQVHTPARLLRTFHWPIHTQLLAFPYSEHLTHSAFHIRTVDLKPELWAGNLSPLLAHLPSMHTAMG